MTTAQEILVVPANEQVVERFDFENGNSEKPDGWDTGAWKPLEAKFKWENNISHSGLRSLGIFLNTPNDAYWTHSVNLEPQKIYRLIGYLKGDNIINRENGQMGAHLNALTWENTDNKTGTFDWQRVNLIFQAPPQGATEIKCRLGGWYNTVTGRAWFDDIALTSNPLTKYEGFHVYLMLEPADLTAITDSNMRQWVINLDNAYNAYSDLIGTKPFNGEKMGILSIPQYPGGWAVAGNPIKWLQPYVRSELDSVNNGNWSFGILHEIGHNFDIGGWNWDAEFFANFKMYYVVETLNATVNQGKKYTGSELGKYYQIDSGGSYEKTLSFGKYEGDGLLHKFITIKDAVNGWEPFKKTFRYFLSLPANQIPNTKLNEFNLFIDKLTEFSGKDVRNLFNETEMSAIVNKLK